MSSFEAKDYDCYSFTISLHPNGTQVTVDKTVHSRRPLSQINMPTPNNFRQFPRQKYYFVLNDVQFTTGDDPYPAGTHQDLFFDVGVGGVYNYTNILSGQSSLSTDPVPDPRASTALIALQFFQLAKTDSYRATDLQTQPMQIPNIFGQTTNFRFIRSTSTVTKNLKGGLAEIATYDYGVTVMKFRHPVLLSFQIYVEKGGDEFN